MNIKRLFSLSTFFFLAFICDAQADIVKSSTIKTIENTIQALALQPHDTLIVFDLDNTVLIQDFSTTKAKPVEDQIIQLIATLQNRGFQLIALTARTPGWEDFSRQQLASLGISFVKNNPKNEDVRLSQQFARYCDGIILCGVGTSGQSVKGLALNDFMQATNNRCSCIISIDDQLNNLIAQNEVIQAINRRFIGIDYRGVDKLAQTYIDKLEQLFGPKTPTGSVIRSKNQDRNKEAIVEYFGKKVPHLMTDLHLTATLQALASRENCLSNAGQGRINTHCVFYSSVPPAVAYLQDILRVFYDVFEGKKISESIPLRARYEEFEKIGDVRDLVAYHHGEDKKDIFSGTWNGTWDGRPIMRKTCIAANSSLFQNIVIGGGSESAFDYFLHPRFGGGANQVCCEEFLFKNLLQDAFASFEIEKYFQPFGLQLLSFAGPVPVSNPISEYLHQNNGGGRILQIFIPREYVDQCVYFCIGAGNGYHIGKTALSMYDDLKNGMSQSDIPVPVLPGRNPGAPWLQARIYLQPDFFMDSSRGIKVFSYNRYATHQDTEQAYFDELYRIAYKIKELNDNDECVSQTKIENKLETLLESFKYYKTRNTSFHSGDLYEHSMWVAKAVQVFGADDNNLWRQGLEQKDIECAYLAGLLHDVGKAGDLASPYFTKPSHPYDGFLYLTGKKNYWINPETKFDFEQMFNNLGIDKETQKIIAVLTGIHWDFGNLMRNGASEKNFRSYLIKLAQLATEAGYNNGMIDERLLKLSILISAADVKGAQPVDHNGKPIFGVQACCCTATHHSGTNQYDVLAFDSKGIQFRQQLLDFFRAQQAPAEVVAPVAPSIDTMSPPVPAA